MTVKERIGALLNQEIADFDAGAPAAAATLQAFRDALREPREVTVNFSGGITQTCWSVTRSNGDYRVIYLPSAGYFSLCVESVFGPLDIGVHGSAIGCFSSV
jgi:hypothetical protein